MNCEQVKSLKLTKQNDIYSYMLICIDSRPEIQEWIDAIREAISSLG